MKNKNRYLLSKMEIGIVSVRTQVRAVATLSPYHWAMAAFTSDINILYIYM